MRREYAYCAYMMIYVPGNRLHSTLSYTRSIYSNYWDINMVLNTLWYKKVQQLWGQMQMLHHSFVCRISEEFVITILYPETLGSAINGVYLYNCCNRTFTCRSWLFKEFCQDLLS